jgi:renal tumor antigen
MHSKPFPLLILSVAEYRLISKKGEGTFSEVLKAQSIKTGKYVAIKCMKAHFYNIDQVIYT